MSYPLGAQRGLAACASEAGKFGVLALDHRQNLRAVIRPTDPASVTYDEMVRFKREVVRALAPMSTGVLLDPEIGVAQCIADGSLPPRAGLLVAIEATGYVGPATARESRILDGWSVAKAKRLGADAAKLLIYYHPDAPNAATQERLVAEVAAQCATEDLALFVEPLSFSIDSHTSKLTGEERRRVVVETARRLTSIGGHVLKAEFPYDESVTDRDLWRSACEELDAASSVPWVLLSGGVDDQTFEAQATVACAAGASGIIVGRSVWTDAATLPSGEQAPFLESTSIDRLRRLVDLADRLGQPWHQHRGNVARLPWPTEGWYRNY